MDFQFLGTRFHYDHLFISDPISFNLIKLWQIGEICLEPGFEVSAHNQFCYEISYIISGNGFFEYNGEKKAVKAGDVIISPNSGEHAIYSSAEKEISYAYIGFDFIDNVEVSGWSAELLKKNKQEIHGDSDGIYTYFRKCMDEFYRYSEPNLLLVESYLVQIIMLTSRKLPDTEKALRTEEKIEGLGQLVFLIIKYVDRNIEKPITVYNIAESLGYSIYHISHTFKSKMHITLQDYIIEKKIEKSKELMALNRFSLTEISEKLGYLNIQSFSRSFKKKTGISPSEYVTHIK